MAIANLPDEILYHHIFGRLPVKSILCFRSVCKSWNRMLRDHQFVKLHLKNHQNKKKLLIRAEVSNYYSIDCDGTEMSSYCSNDRDHEVVGSRLPAPPLAMLTSRTYAEIFGSCNGLIAVFVYRYSLCLDYDFILWNPSTGESKYLNDTNRVDTFNDKYGCDYDSNVDISYYKYGFVYDSVNDDYKILSVSFGFSETPVYVFSLRNNSWKKVNNADYNFAPRVLNTTNPAGVELNGYLYWLLEIRLQSSERILYVLGFGLRDENFAILALPDDMFDKNVDFYSNTNVSERGLKEMGRSCLALFHFYMEYEFVLWTLKEPENKDSKWEKLINLCLSSPDHMLTISIRPLWFTKDGKVFLIIGCDKHQEHQHQHQYNIKVYDPQKKSLGCDLIHDIKITSKYNMKIMEMAYVQSLVSPNMFESGTR